jgi:hypothetical protein
MTNYLDVKLSRLPWDLATVFAMLYYSDITLIAVRPGTLPPQDAFRQDTQ